MKDKSSTQIILRTGQKNIPCVWTIFREENFALISMTSGFPLFLIETFGNEMCQTWSKELENEGEGAFVLFHQ